MTAAEQLAVLAAGVGAGVLSSTVGVASLLSFPVLLATGLPPVVANVSNTLGLIPAGLSGSFGYRAELRAHPRVTWTVLASCAVGAIAGAGLLLAAEPGVFEAVVPWLILFACLLVGVQPQLSRWLARRHDGASPPPRRLAPSRTTTLFATLTGVYGGYFGAGSGVMMVAVLALGLDLDLPEVNALKTLAVLAGNLTAGAVFVLVADVDWGAVLLLAAGSAVGGYVGARVGRRLPPALFRGLVVTAGIVAALLLV